MKTNYEKPQIDVQKFDVDDVITESSVGTTDVLTTKAHSGDFGDEI